MSFARFGADGSDVYLFENAGGWLECCGCALPTHSSYRTRDVAAFLAHLDEHRAAGHHVPAAASERVHALWLDGGFEWAEGTPL